jgi:mono/diheme cytochrome c family protein
MDPGQSLRGATLITALLATLITALVASPAVAAPATAGSVYLENCAICHGDDAQGPSNPDYQGSILVGNAFVHRLNDAALLAFLKKGRQPDAPDSQLHVLMPAFDYLSADELTMVITFLRSINP